MSQPTPIADAPRVSVVVPVYDVERYLEECLDSIAHQSFGDLEVIMVDDGSTDGSAAIAGRYARRDRRFRLVTQPNGGLSKARNTGADLARGEFLCFVDSDDKLAPDFCELLLGALEQTGSDFATGNVLRFDSHDTRQAPFVARTFRQTRLATHVTRFRGLLVDRIVPNKMWRRSFWDEHGFRFPEGVVHEDVPVVVPAQFLARSVDVIADHVYLYREREGDDRSITQRRNEIKMLLDRLAGVEHVTEFLGDRVSPEARRWYQQSVVAEDLRYHLDVLDDADDAYRQTFLERVNAYLAAAPADVERGLPAIDRLKYHLVRRRLLPELLEVLRFHKQQLAHVAPIPVRGGWEGDYPFRGDRRLAIPRRVYRLGVELRASATVESLRWDGDELVIQGSASLTVAGAPAPGATRVQLIGVRPGRMARLRRHVLPLRLKTTSRPADDGSGAARFQARLSLRRLRRRGRWDRRPLDLLVVVRNRGITRRFSKFAAAAEIAPVQRPVGETLIARAVRRPNGTLQLEMRRGWAVARSHRVAGEVLRIEGTLCFSGRGLLALEVTRHDTGPQLHAVIHVAGEGPLQRFVVDVPLPAVTGDAGDPANWELWVSGRGGRERLELDHDSPIEPRTPGAKRGMARLAQTATGHAALLTDPRPQPQRGDRYVRVAEDGSRDRPISIAP
jgi:CDP-glycerol glycerophosphotransferase